MVAGDAPSPGEAGRPGTGSRSAGTTSSGWEQEPGGATGLPFRCQASPVAAALAKQPGSLMVVSLVEDRPAPGTQSLPGAQGLPEGAGTAPWVREPPRASSAQRLCPPARPSAARAEGSSWELQEEHSSKAAPAGQDRPQTAWDGARPQAPARCCAPA